jgi:hypothetical protein
MSTLRAKVGLTRSNQVTEMLRKSVAPYVVAAFLILGVVGCDKKSGEAVVLTKEHIDAALPTKETPTTNQRLVRMSSFVPWRMMRLPLMDT